MTSIILITTMLIFIIMILLKFPLSLNVKKFYLVLYSSLLIALFVTGYNYLKPFLIDKKAVANILVKSQEVPITTIPDKKIQPAGKEKI